MSRSELWTGINQGVQVRSPVISIGSEAAGILHDGRIARVFAVFDRSVYVQCDQKVFCIGVASLGQGPLHVLLASDRVVLPFGIAVGDSIYLKQDSLQGAGCTASNRSCPAEEFDTELFSGKVWGMASVPLSFQRAQEALKLLVPTQLPGFAWMPASSDWPCEDSASSISNTGVSAIDSNLVEQSLPALKCLYRWLESARESPSEVSRESISRAASLLGAGPGLTPSGDDLLAGVMLALHRLQRADLVDSLWQVLEPHLAQRTNVISGAHLQLAALGQCSESALSLLECVFDDASLDQSDDVQATAANIRSLANRMGASSGWDMLAGMSLVLRAF